MDNSASGYNFDNCNDDAIFTSLEVTGSVF